MIDGPKRRPRHVAPPLSSGAAALLALVCCSAPASAAPLVTRATVPVSFESPSSLCPPLRYDSGWVPSGAGVQVRITTLIEWNCAATLAGDVILSWHPDASVLFAGSPGGGEFRIAPRVALSIDLRWDIDTPFGPHSGETVVSDPDPAPSWSCADAVVFPPFLLPGNPARPAQASCEIPRETRVFVDRSGWPFPEADRTRVAVEVEANLHASLRGLRATASGRSIDREYAEVPVALDGASTMSMPLRFVGEVDVDGTVLVRPVVEFEVSGFEFGFDAIDLPLPVSPAFVETLFGEATARFLLPRIAVPEAFDFGSVVVGHPRPLRLLVENRGLAELQIRAATDEPFAVEGVSDDPDGPPFVVPPGGLGDLVVRFSPTGPGSASGTLLLETNDPDRSSIEVRLTGEGTTRAGPDVYGPDDGSGGDGGPVWYDDGGCACGVAAPRLALGPALRALLFGLVVLAPGRRRARRAAVEPGRPEAYTINRNPRAGGRPRCDGC